ncbi:hypothetical protein SDC9_142476 [bioreactor metagenome]|uniref:Uncharacterized protein n=1 Tax=bioreactor metagenome TaxID=1076179 RepID=A0A645E428_9ZZZZ
MGVLYHFFGDADIFLERMFGTVYHNRRKSAVDAFFADFEIFTVIKVKGDRQAGIGDRGFHEF